LRDAPTKAMGCESRNSLICFKVVIGSYNFIIQHEKVVNLIQSAGVLSPLPHYRGANTLQQSVITINITELVPL
jgi:hypothetical protein